MLEALGNLGDFVGGIAVIATLIYLAVQVRQNTQLLRANALSTSSASNVSFNHLLGSNPAAARVFQVGLESFASLSEDEQRQFLQLLRGLLTSYEHMFHQYELGMLDEDVWHHRLGSLRSTLSLPHLAVWWEHRKAAFDPSFAEEMDGAAPAPPTTLASDVIAKMLAKAPSGATE